MIQIHVSSGSLMVNCLTKSLTKGRFQMQREYLVFGREHFPR